MIKDAFKGRYIEYKSDVYIADYTEYAKTHPDKHGIGVVVADSPFADLHAMHLFNPYGICIGAIDFEACSGLLKDAAGNLVPQCEGLCFASRAKRKGWVLLVELKYCMSHNVDRNIVKAVNQLIDSVRFLRDDKGYISLDNRVYCAVGIPNHDELAPFQSFIYTQDKLIELQETHNIVLFFLQNQIKVSTPQYLFPIK